MLRRILGAVFGRGRKSEVGRLSGPENLARLPTDASVAGVQTEGTGLQQKSSSELMEICDAYWSRLGKPRIGTTGDPFSAEANRRYNAYVEAIGELSNRGPEILDWAFSRLDHTEYDAREQAAFLLASLGRRGQLGDRADLVVESLCRLAERPVQNDSKEAQANTAAIMALFTIGDKKAIRVARQVLTSKQWDDDDNQWFAAEALGKMVGESFTEKENAIDAARAWLAGHPEE